MVDPFASVPTIVMVGDVIDPITRQKYERDPRHIAKKAEAYLQATGAGDTAYFGAEAEFFIFDNISFDQNQHEGYYYIDSDEGRWNSAAARITWVTGRVTRKVTSRSRRWTIIRICARRWWRR